MTEGEGGLPPEDTASAGDGQPNTEAVAVVGILDSAGANYFWASIFSMTRAVDPPR